MLEKLLDFEIEFKDRASVYVLLGEAYNGLKNYTKSQEILDKGISEYPKNHLLYYTKAISLEQEEKYQEALENYKLSAQCNIEHMPSHLQLGVYAAREGHFTEAMLSLMTCLMIEPNGKKSASIVSFMEEMSDGSYSPEKKNITISSKGDDYEDLNLLFANKIALQSKYKVKLSISTALGRQMHLILSTIKYDKNDEGYWNQMYVRLYKQIYDAGLLDEMTLFAIQSVENPSVQKKVAAKRSLIDKFLKEASAMWSNNIMNQYMEFEGKMSHVTVVYQKAGIIIGKMNDDKKMYGNWYYYYPQGNLKLKAELNSKGEKEGLYEVWHEFTTKRIQDEKYEANVITGVQNFYYSSGELYQKVMYADGELKDTVYTYYRGGQISEKLPVGTNGRNGLSTSYYQNGSLKSEINYLDGLPDGKYITYHSNGQKEIEMNIENDVLNGIKKVYYPNGQLKSEFSFKDNLQDGPYKVYHANGQLWKEGSMLAGKYYGANTEYYSNGIIASKGEYDENGKENGTQTNYDSQGKKYISYSFKKGSLQKIEVFDKSEKVIQTIEKSGKKIAYVNYYPTRTISIEGEFNNDQRSGVWNYYDNYGSISKIEKYENGLTQDSVIGYHPNGAIHYIAEQKDGYNHGMYLKYNQFGVLTQEGRYKEGEPVNDWYEYYSDGTISEEYAFNNGVQHGIFRNYSVDGKLSSYDLYSDGEIVATVYLDTNGNEIGRFGEFNGEIRLKDPANKYDRFVANYTSGILNGESKWFDAEKNVITKGTHVNGKKEGDWFWYNSEGVLVKKINYQNGQVHGELIQYYSDGKISSVGKYEYGQLQGLTTWYYENGKKESEINYSDGERHGKMTTYGYNGGIQQFRYYDRGVLLSYSYLDKTGKEVAEIPVKNGESSFTVYYQNGQKSIEQTRINGMLHGVYKEYYSDGQLMTESNYYYNDRNGHEKQYHQNGKLKYEATYKNDELDGVEKEYYLNGNLKLSNTYKNGVLHGELKKYDANGTLLKTYVYYNGEMVDVK